MRLSINAFRPGWAPTFAVAAMLAILLGLGNWQLHRAVQKRELLAAYALRAQAPPLPVPALESLADPAFQPVSLRGQFDAGHSFLLDNRVRDGEPGVELLQPFQDQASGIWVLVNRGWLPWPDRRTPPAFSTPAEVLNIQGTVYVAPGATFQLHADPLSGSWPRLVTALDASQAWPLLGREGFAHEVRMSPGPAAYTLGWPVVSIGPQTHIGYAVQWFAMALALLLLYLYFGLHNDRRANPAEEPKHGRGHRPTPSA